MGKFEVVFEEVWTRTFVVEAETEEEAEAEASEYGASGGDFRFSENQGVEVRKAD